MILGRPARAAVGAIGLACALTTPAAATAQTPATAPQTFRSTTDVVEVDASVFDKNGKAVTDLTAADFALKENGVPQRISTVYLVTGDAALLRMPTTTIEGVQLPRRIELKQRVMVFVLDLAHLSNAGYVRSRTAIRSFIADPATPADVVGVVVNGQMLNNRLETDRAVLLKAFDAIPAPKASRAELLREWPKLIDEGEATRVAHGDDTLLGEIVRRACTERPDECSGRAGTEMVQRQIEDKSRQIAADAGRDAQITLQAMTALANGLSKFPGTKQVAVFSEGFYIDELVGSLRNVVGLAAQSGVRISTLDARGINNGPSADFTGSSPAALGAGMNLDTDSDVLSSLANDTGGRFIQRFNNLRPALDAIAGDIASYYVIAYPPDAAPDGAYRTIDVSVTRPGLTVRARKGYLAAPHNAAVATAAANARGTAPSASPAPPPPASTSTPAPASTASPAPDAASAVRLRPGGSDHVSDLESMPASATSGDAAKASDLANKGWAFYGTGDVEHARESLSAAVSTHAAPLWAVYALGLSEYALKSFDAAATSWEQVRALRPDYEPAYLDLADAYLSQGKLTEGTAVLREATSRWPNDAAPHDALGVVLVRRDDLDGAIKEFDLATQKAPKDGLGFYNLGRALQLRYDRLLRTTANPDSTAARTLIDRDRTRAVAAYEAYINIGGPFERQARDALALLSWKTP